MFGRFEFRAAELQLQQCLAHIHEASTTVAVTAKVPERWT